tara:strand:+ start:1334 stop:1585 length:252 start_codon:yes stop_codon:yes gene_type:complete
MTVVFVKRSEKFSNKSQLTQPFPLLKPSNSSSGRSVIKKKVERRGFIRKNDHLTSSTRDLVEFYWSNSKRFSGGYIGFPVKVR